MIVLDCCAAIALLRNTPDGAALRALVLQGEKVAAPRFLQVELAHTLAKYVRCGLLARADLSSAFAAAVGMVDEFCDDEALLEEAMGEGARLDYSTYELLYAVLARRRGATLFTLDCALQALCLRIGIDCVSLDVGE